MLPGCAGTAGWVCAECVGTGWVGTGWVGTGWVGTVCVGCGWLGLAGCVCVGASATQKSATASGPPAAATSAVKAGLDRAPPCSVLFPEAYARHRPGKACSFGPAEPSPSGASVSPDSLVGFAGLGATDVPEEATGNWVVEGNTITLSEGATQGVPREMEVVTADGERLVILKHRDGR